MIACTVCTNNEVGLIAAFHGVASSVSFSVDSFRSTSPSVEKVEKITSSVANTYIHQTCPFQQACILLTLGDSSRSLRHLNGEYESRPDCPHAQ